MIDNILLAFESLRMNKLRALLTMLGIIIGIGSVIAINTVGSSITNSVNDSMSSLGASAITVSLTQKSEEEESGGNVRLAMFAKSDPSETDLITEEMIDDYKNTFPEQVEVVKLSRSVGSGTVINADDASSATSVTVLGVNDVYMDAEEVKVLYGRAIDNDKDVDRKVCVVSDCFVEDALGVPASRAIGERITITINNTPYFFYIEGVYAYEEETASSLSRDNQETVTNMYLPIETARLLNGDGKGYQSLTVVTSAGTDTATFLNTTGDFFASYYTQNDTWTCEATSLETMISTMTEMLETISFAIAAIAGISLLVGGIGVMNIMLVSITERTKEIGTRKALGATNASIRMQFITESIVICLIGGMIGVVFGVLLGGVVSNMLGYGASPAANAIFCAVGFSMLVGVVFGYAPANKAAMLNPIDALRYE